MMIRCRECMMRLYSIVLSSVLSVSLLGGYTAKAWSVDATAEETLFVQKMKDSYQWMEEQPLLWPGHDVHTTPTFLHFVNHHTYALHFSPQNEHWQVLMDFNPTIYFLAEDEYKLDETPFTYGRVIDDNPPSYVWRYLDQKSPDTNVLVALHERFHVFQMSNSSPDLQFGQYNALQNLENYALAYLELDVLKNYWLNHDLEALKDYVAINHFRLSQLDTASVHYENAKEKIEGGADYFAMMASALDNQTRKEYLQKSANDCTAAEMIGCQLQWRYYYTGAVSAFALDELAPMTWKERYITNGVSPKAQLEQLLAMSQDESKARIEQSKKRYYYAQLRDRLAEAFDIYWQAVAKHEARYAALNGTPLIISNGFSAYLMSARESEEQYYIKSGMTMMVALTGEGLTPDKHVQLHYRKLPYLYEDSEVGLTLKLDKDTVVTLDGQLI